MPSAKMGGNMMDMKKKLRKTQATESQPSRQNTTMHMTIFRTPQTASRRRAENVFSRPAPVNRPRRNKTKATDKRLAAPLSLMQRTPSLLASNQPSSQFCKCRIFAGKLVERLVNIASHEAGIGGTTVYPDFLSAVRVLMKKLKMPAWAAT